MASPSHGIREPWLLWTAAALAALFSLPVVLTIWEAVAFVSLGTGPVGHIESLLGPICHHLPDLTLEVDGRLLTVCARCTGLHGAVAVGGFFGAMTMLRRPVVLAVCIVALAAGMLGALAAVLEGVGLLHTSNGTRVVLGALLGLGPTILAGVSWRVLAEAGLGTLRSGQGKPTRES